MAVASFSSSLTVSPSPSIRRANRVWTQTRLRNFPRATLSIDSGAASGVAAGAPKVLLEVKGLKAVVKESGKELLHGVDLTIHEGEVLFLFGVFTEIICQYEL
jgi:hypothetical protein